MPELPDVEVMRRSLDRKLRNKTIVKVRVESPSLLKGTSTRELASQLQGARVRRMHRHGKYLLTETDRGAWLAFHFGMTGRLAYWNTAAPPPHIHVQLDFERTGHLAYLSTRKLGRIALIRSIEDFVRREQLGIDASAVQLDRAHFGALAAGRGSAVKCWLMDQHRIAGIGNLYSDEILFQGRIHPLQKVGTLSEAQMDRLHGALRSVLDTAVRADANPQRLPPTFLLRHRKPGQPCPRRCGGAVERLSACGRTGYYCPNCQRLEQ